MLSQILSCPGDSPGCQGPEARDSWAGDCQAGQRAAALSLFFHDRDPGSESDSESDRDSLSVPAASRWGHQLGDDEPDANRAATRILRSTQARSGAAMKHEVSELETKALTWAMIPIYL